MAKLTLNEVSKSFKVSRSTLYRAIKEGRISRGSDGLFDVAEVVRCFGDVKPLSTPEKTSEIKNDDSDLRQLVEFMKHEIEGYKDREKRYLDQIDRFQLLLEYKEPSQNLSHEKNETVSKNQPLNTDIKNNIESDLSQDVSNFASKHVSVKHYETSANSSKIAKEKSEEPKKRGFWSKFFLPNG